MLYMVQKSTNTRHQQTDLKTDVAFLLLLLNYCWDTYKASL